MSDAQIVEEASDNGQVAWRDGKRGEYVPARDRNGIIYRQGEESVDQAYARAAVDAAAKDAPKKKPGKTRKQPAPTQIDLRQLEVELEKALSAPAMIGALAGDPWPAEHCSQTAPVLARNLVACAEANPWFKEKLLAAMGGEGMLMTVMLFVNLAGAAFAYAIPMVVYYWSPPFVPEPAVDLIRQRYNVPARRPHDLEADLAGYSAPAEDTYPSEAGYPGFPE
jgi:hypothetical protein